MLSHAEDVQVPDLSALDDELDDFDDTDTTSDGERDLDRRFAELIRMQRKREAEASKVWCSLSTGPDVEILFFAVSTRFGLLTVARRPVRSLLLLVILVFWCSVLDSPTMETELLKPTPLFVDFFAPVVMDQSPVD